jgi:predicted TIM-barrel fold metal-dependent hydrolase
MDILDSQIHLGPGHITETLAAMDAVGVKQALVDEFWIGMDFMPFYKINDGVRRPITPTAELAALTYPDRFSYLVRIDRRDPEMPGLSRLAAAKPHARALRIPPGINQTELTALAEGGYDPLLKAALDAGLDVIFVAIPGHAPAMGPVIKKFPGLKFVIDHCGMPSPPFTQAQRAKIGMNEPLPPQGDTSTEEGKWREFEKVLRLADQHPNVGLKWAHAQRMFGVSGYPFPALRPFMKKAFDSFGAERMMWASDVSANQSGESWAQLLFWIMDNPDLSASDRAQFLGGTARKWLKWPVS